MRVGDFLFHKYGEVRTINLFAKFSRKLHKAVSGLCKILGLKPTLCCVVRVVGLDPLFQILLEGELGIGMKLMLDCNLVIIHRLLIRHKLMFLNRLVVRLSQIVQLPSLPE